MHETKLAGSNLSDANLRNVIMQSADLTGAILENVNLSRANLLYADLSGAYLDKVNFKGTWLSEVNLSNAIMRNVTNLSQPELNAAFILRGMKKPDLDGSKCALTGQPLEWQGMSR